MPVMPQVHALGANKTGLPGLILSYASCRGLWIPQQGWDDLSPYANNGSATDVTYSGTAPFARMPIVPGVFVAANSSRVTVADHASLQFTTEMTAMIWFSGSPANEGTIFSRADTGANARSWRMAKEPSTGKQFVYLSALGTTGTVKSYIADNSSFNTGWHQYAFTFSSGTLKLFFDGVETPVTKISDGAVNSIYAGGTVPTHICCAQNSGNTSLHASGSVACAAVFNAALTAADIQSMFLVGAIGP